MGDTLNDVIAETIAYFIVILIGIAMLVIGAGIWSASLIAIEIITGSGGVYETHSEQMTVFIVSLMPVFLYLAFIAALGSVLGEDENI